MNNKFVTTILLVAIAIISTGCAEKEFGKKITGLTPIATPALAPSGEPNIGSSSNNQILFSWVERDTTNNTHTLRFSYWENGSWSDAKTIASGSDWFVNWADFPAVAIQSDRRLLASWLAKSDTSTYAYDVVLAQSSDGGNSWPMSFSPHADKTPTEHGFVSMQPLRDGTFGVAWLDGRQMVDDGPMTLRFAAVDAESKLSNEKVLDDRVCDCCQTSMVVAGDGSILVAYRDRSENEIRDMSIVRYADSVWSRPLAISIDGWQIAGCPVNGPALTANESLVAAGWFTMGKDSTAKVLCAFSKDFGKSFEAPIRIDNGQPLGRVDILFVDENTALVSWLETAKNKTSIAVRTVDIAGTLSETVTVTETLPGRKSGFARMGLTSNGVIIAWTDATGIPLVKTSLITLQ